MQADKNIIYELDDDGFRFVVFTDRFEITQLKRMLSSDNPTKVILTKNEIVGLDKFKAKQLYEPDYIAVFTEDGDGIHQNKFALSKRGEVDKLYKALKRLSPKSSLYLLKKMFFQILRGKSWLQGH